MEERSESGRSSKGEKINSRKSKKRSSRKSSVNMENWASDEIPPMINHNGGVAVPPVADYRQMFWQQPGMPHQHMQQAHNGQRLFAAMSDPSVCGYSPMSMAYTMEPVSVPPMYQPVYHPISRPHYRAYRGRLRKNITQNNHTVPQTPGGMTNGYSSLQENTSNYSTPMTYQNGDYASLPPSANNHQAENTEELNSEHRRYSDPGLGPADLRHLPNSDDSDTEESGSSITTVGKSNKLVLSLVEQMGTLREANSQMFKELHETKSELESIKIELTRLKHSGSSDYQPGMLSDIVREMRDANKALDEAMIGKVNTMVEQQNKQRTMEFESLRVQLDKMTEEKEIGYRRIAKLEEQVAALKLNANNEGREIAAFEEETLALRRELQEARASKNLTEIHAAKLEKLVEILRKKMNGASNEETVADIRELVSSGLSRPPTVHGGFKISSAKIEELLRSSSLNTKEYEDELEAADEDVLSSCDPNSGSSANSPSRNIASANDSVASNASLTGPVTDL